MRSAGRLSHPEGRHSYPQEHTPTDMPNRCFIAKLAFRSKRPTNRIADKAGGFCPSCLRSARQGGESSSQAGTFMANLTHRGAQPGHASQFRPFQWAIPLRTRARGIILVAGRKRKGSSGVSSDTPQSRFWPGCGLCAPRRVHSLGNCGRRESWQSLPPGEALPNLLLLRSRNADRDEESSDARPSCGCAVGRGMDPWALVAASTRNLLIVAKRTTWNRPSSHSIRRLPSRILRPPNRRSLLPPFLLTGERPPWRQRWPAAACCKPGGMSGSSPSVLAWVSARLRREASGNFSRFSPSSIRLRRCCASTGPIRISAIWLAIVPKPR